MLNRYLYKPFIFDFSISLILVSFNLILNKFGLILARFSKDSISDLLNELVSTSMTLSGFVLTAMAIVAATKDNTERIDDYTKAKSGRDYFYSGPGYISLVKVYTNACVTFVGMFFWFSILRSVIESIEGQALFHLTYFGIFFTSMTLIRCVYLVQAVMKIK